MACHCPLPAWKGQHVNTASGKRPMVFRYREGFRDLPTVIPCGQCLGCRLDWAGDWAARCEKEAKLYEHNCFITLTYKDEEVPFLELATVRKRDFQLFMKRLRKAYDHPIRFFASGEYGDKTQRPHYHALLFNHRFVDQQLLTRGGRHSLFISSELEGLWPFGFSTIGSVTYDSASYVARYVVKKANGPTSYPGREPPFILMSRRPGIGSAWYDEFKTDVYPLGEIVVGDGKTRRPPRYFDNKYKLENPSGFLSLQIKRRAHARSNASEHLPSRLYTKQESLKSKTSNLIRSL